MEQTNITIIGAGVVGLAVACRLVERFKNIVVIEKYPGFGQETSSRNSEVIHAGIYYPGDSLKARLCVEGRNLLYSFCKKHNISCKKTGKLIVAADESEMDILEELYNQGKCNGVDDLMLYDKSDIQKIEPHIKAYAGIYSPSTGIMDTHGFMKSLEALAKNNKVMFAYGCEAVGIDKTQHGYEIEVLDTNGERLKIATRILINCAGLSSDTVAQMAGIDIEREKYKLHYSKGEYFTVNTRGINIAHLVYPVPAETSLGIHTVLDLQGQLKLGPNAFYVDTLGYDVDVSHKEEFYNSAKKYLPFIELDDLNPDMSGIRAKLQAQGEGIRDFVISNEKDKGFSGLINCIGIESPGLTASLAISAEVERQCQEL